MKIFAQPLVELCDEHVAQDIDATMKKAVEKWNETNDNLKQICDKYKGAVRLWRKYCDDSQAIKSTIDEQFATLDDLIEGKSFEEIQVTKKGSKLSQAFPKLFPTNFCTQSDPV